MDDAASPADRAVRDLSRALGLAAAFGIAFVVIRARVERDFAYLFLLWNLLLAWVPWRAALAAKGAASPLARTLWLGVWLVFLPNSYYVVTDLRHVHHPPGVGMNWVDLMAVVPFAWTSAMFGFGSVAIVQKLVARLHGAAAGWTVAIGALALSGFGVYLGRFQRWNSWDALLDPLALLGDVWAQVRHPFQHIVGTSFSITFAGFVITTYLTLVALARLELDGAGAPVATTACSEGGGPPSCDAMRGGGDGSRTRTGGPASGGPCLHRLAV